MRVQEGCMTAVRRLFAAICAFGAMSLAAQTRPTTTQTTTIEPVTAPVSADTDRDLNNPRALRLSLDDALKTAVERNVGISLQRYTFLEAGESLRSTYGIYDWFTTADIGYQNFRSPTISQAQSSSQKKIIGDFGVSQLIPTGGSYSVTFNNNKQNLVGGFTPVNPSYNSNLTIPLNQPL